MTTNYDKNAFTQNGQLYIMPTLTSDEIGTGSVLDGYTYPLPGCTDKDTNNSACSATSDRGAGTVCLRMKLIVH